MVRSLKTPYFYWLIACLWLAGSVAWAGEATFGLELTFTNQWLKTAVYEDEFTADSSESETYRDLMKLAVQRVCPQCKISPRTDDKGIKIFRVNVNNEWWFEITQDPGVIEVKTSPMTYAELQSRRDAIDQLIFKTAATAEMVPDVGEGGGHIHIGFKSAFDSPLHFRNFMVDFANHPELALGGLEKDLANAPPIASLPPSRRAQFERLLRMYDAGELDVYDFCYRVNEEVYSGRPIPEGGGGEPKYNAFNVVRVDPEVPVDQQTAEIRSIRTQTSVDRVLSDVGLLDARLRLIAKLTEPIPYINRGPPGVEKSARDFYRYVEEAGRDFTPYRSDIPKSWLTEIDRAFGCEIATDIYRGRATMNQTNPARR